MGIMTRLIKLFKADINGVMDQIEDKGLLLKQHLRDMENILLQKKAKLSGYKASLENIESEFERYDTEIKKNEDDITLAIKQNRDDIAKTLIRKLKPMLSHKEELKRSKKLLDKQIKSLCECIETQQQQLDHLLLRSSDYLKNNGCENDFKAFMKNNIFNNYSDEEIEIELIQRKTAINER